MYFFLDEITPLENRIDVLKRRTNMGKMKASKMISINSPASDINSGAIHRALISRVQINSAKIPPKFEFFNKNIFLRTPENIINKFYLTSKIPPEILLKPQKRMYDCEK